MGSNRGRHAYPRRDAQTVGQVLEEEVKRAPLQPLPIERFPYFQEAQRSVRGDGHAEVDRPYDSVPLEYVTWQVWVRWDSRTALYPHKLHANDVETGRVTRLLHRGSAKSPFSPDASSRFIDDCELDDLARREVPFVLEYWFLAAVGLEHLESRCVQADVPLV